MKCDYCEKEDETTGAIIEGKFGQYCRDCRTKLRRSVSPGYASYSRARDREDNAKDLIQPWSKDGTPNTEFIRNYPDESKEMFTEKELNNYG